MVAHNDVIALLVHDPLRLAPAGGSLTLSDGTLQMEVDLADPSVDSRVAADFREEQQAAARYLRRLSAPLLMISNQGDVVAQVRRHLGVPGSPS